jgi:hypothetical protein
VQAGKGRCFLLVLVIVIALLGRVAAGVSPAKRDTPAADTAASTPQYSSTSFAKWRKRSCGQLLGWLADVEFPQPLDAPLQRGPVAHIKNFRAFARPLQQSSEDSAGPELEKKIAAHLEHSLHAVGPAHRRGHLILERAPDVIGRFNLGAVHVAHHREGWVLQNNLLQRFAYLEVSALHEPRMVGAGDVKQRGATDAVFSSEAHRRLDFRAFARDDDLPGGIEIGDIDIGGGGECAHGRFVAADHRGHRAGSRLAGRFHETATLFDQEQTIFKGKGLSRGVRRPFA